LLFDLWVDALEPSLLHLLEAGEVSCGEGVLEGETGGDANLGLGLFVGEFAGERDEVAGL
jgi:hypothetical protein